MRRNGETIQSTLSALEKYRTLTPAEREVADTLLEDWISAHEAVQAAEKLVA